MVSHLVGLFLAVVELLEAEATRLQQSARQLLVSAAVVAIVTLVAVGALVTGSAFLSWSAYAALRPSLGDALAALAVGLTVWTVAGGAAWLVLGKLRR